MKNFEKKLANILSVLILTLSACSGNDSELTPPQNNPTVENYQLLKSVVETEDWNQWSDQLFIKYQDGLMTEFDGGKGVFHFQYNSEGKIEKATNNFNDVLNFTYIGNHLNQLNTTGSALSFPIGLYEYDNSYNVISISGESEFNKFTYDDNGIAISWESVEDGNGTTTYTYEFDNKINPFYPIWLKYSYIADLEITPYDITPMFFKHNPTKIYRDNKLIYEVNYTYDSKGYPIKSRYKIYTNNGFLEGTANYSYNP